MADDQRKSPEQLRRLAEDARALATVTRVGELKRMMLGVAFTYERVAEQLEQLAEQRQTYKLPERH